MHTTVLLLSMSDDVPFFSEQSSALFFSHSGKTIPNGTDKNQLGTPENEGKFQKCSLFTVKALLRQWKSNT